MKFIGIDLGWTSGDSGLCSLQWRNQKLELLAITHIQGMSEILEWLDEQVKPEEAAMIAVDAPTIIPNTTGMRLPDKLTHKYYGRYHAGCYPANLSRPFAQRTIEVGLSLEQRGFVHAAKIEPQKLSRYQIEVFPHPAMVNLFRLDRILKYKKGKLAERKTELRKLQKYILEILPTLTPSLEVESIAILREELDTLTGKACKNLEDKLDSLICAYIGAYWWYWGETRNQVLGDERTGYIVVTIY